MENNHYDVESIIGGGVEYSNQIAIIRSGLNLNEILPIIEECSSFLENHEREKILGLLKESKEEDLREVCCFLSEFEPKKFEEVVWLYLCVCSVFLLKEDLGQIIPRYSLLQKTFRISVEDWNFNPVHIHVICSYLWQILKDDNDVLYLSRKICTISPIAFNISVCLAWASIFRLRNCEINMFRFHKFSKLVDMLEAVSSDDLKNNINSMYVLFQLVSFLQTAIVMQKSHETITKRFTAYFSCERSDLERLKTWCIFVNRIFEINVSDKADALEDNALIIELIKFDILPSLDTKLST